MYITINNEKFNSKILKRHDYIEQTIGVVAGERAK